MPQFAGRRKVGSAQRCRRRRIAIEPLEPRNLFAALPLGASPEDTAEFLLGRVAVVPVLFESTGQVDADSEDWTAPAIQTALAKVHEGVNWWAEALDQLGTVHSLEFVIDDTFARNPVETPFEPISRTSQEHSQYVGAFLEGQGYGDAGSLHDAVRQFNHATRERLDTDWAFTMFIINSANDDDGQFASGSEFNVAFAYPGGLYMVVPSTRPASTIAHEMGHIFWTRDEYPGAGSWTDRRGYYNAQNLNAADNPTPGFFQQPSIMRSGSGLTHAYANFELPESTMAMLGWRDSDGDGIFDLADVPLSLEGTGLYDASSGIFSFTGHATAVALPNQNSSGSQNDITLNRVDRIEYRLDDGPWRTAIWVGQQASAVQFDLAVAPFETIQLRAIDDRVGVTSEVHSTRGELPLLAGAALGGIALLQQDADGGQGLSPTAMGGVTARLTHTDGSPLLAGAIDSDQLGSRGTGALPVAVSMFGSGAVLDGRVAAVAGHASTGSTAFGYYNRQSGNWQNNWAPDKKLTISFDQPVGSVQLDAIGLRAQRGYGRLEAYDSDGNLLTRVSTSGLRAGEVETMQVHDVAGRIASVQAMGHAWTEIGLDHLRYGVTSEITTDSDGVFRFTGIPDGQYILELTAERLIHHFPDSGDLVTVTGGTSTVIQAGFERVPSPWNNPAGAYDVNGDGRVEPVDALWVLNDIARQGSRILSSPANVGAFVDTNNDGEVGPLDALLVLNEVARRGRPGALGEDAAGATFAGPADASAAEPATEERFTGERADDNATDAVFAQWCVPEKKEPTTGRWGAPEPLSVVGVMIDRS